MPTQKKTVAGAGVGAVVLVVVVMALNSVLVGPTAQTPTAPAEAPSVDRPAATADDAALVEQLFAQERSDEMVTLDGRVDRLLPDDDEGDKHQRFIVRLSTGRTVLVAHNIDLAPRVPLREGEAVRLRGEYEWTERGGTVHWTHHDPGGYREGGWIEHGGRRYE